MTSRREFVVAAGAAAMLAAYGHARAQDTPQWRVIDGMGDVHFDYEPALIDAMRASGMRSYVVTTGTPGLQGPEADGIPGGNGLRLFRDTSG